MGTTSKSVQVWREAVKREKAKTKVKRSKQELEFLPATVELLESPASPVGHAVLFLIIALVVAVLVWAKFGRIDTVSISQGRIIPGGQVKVVQSFNPGVVKEILVRDGQRVGQGDPLIRLDPLEAETDVEALSKEQQIARLEADKLEALVTFLDYPDTASSEQLEKRAQRVLKAAALPDAYARQLRGELQAHIAHIGRLDGERAQLQAQQQATNAEISRLKALIPLAKEHESALTQLLKSGAISKVQRVEARKEVIDLEQSLLVQQNRRAEIALAIQNKADEKSELRVNVKKNALGELKQFQDQVDMASLNLRKAKNRENRNNLLASVDGTVQQLAVHTIGGVVRPADPLMVIVPDDASLEVEATLLNKDIGFVQVGQPVAIKVESFPFTKYGLINGEVTHIAADAVQDERLGLVYTLRASMEKNHIMVHGNPVQLSPGMAVTADIKTGDRAAIEYFLSPLLRYRQEVLRER